MYIIWEGALSDYSVTLKTLLICVLIELELLITKKLLTDQYNFLYSHDFYIAYNFKYILQHSSLT